MMRTPSTLFIISFVLTFILSCGSPTQYTDNGVGGTGNVALAGEDESGIGGTGKAVPNAGVGGTGKQVASGLGGTGKKTDGMGGTGYQDNKSGLGGTGQIADASGVGGTGIIGEVTGFGSIFVNGFEIEIVKDSEIRTDNKVNKTIKPEIGDIVEILAHRVGDETQAKKMNIRHEVVGPVESVNMNRRSFTIIGQSIKLNNPELRLPKLGEMIAVSGMRDQRGIIHATRVSLSKSKSVWLIDRVSNNNSNTLKLGRSFIQTKHANKYRKGDVVRVRASYKNGKLFANEIFSNQAFGNQVSHMVLQGFINKGNRNNYKIGNVQFSTRSIQVRSQLKQHNNRWVRIEVRRNSVGLWEVEQFINDTNLMRGNLTPHHSNIKMQQMYNHKSNSPSSARQRFNRSLSDDMKSPTRNHHSPANNSTGGMKSPTGDSNKPMPNMPAMPKPKNSGGMGMGSGNNSNNKNLNTPRMPGNRSGRTGGMM